MCCQQQDAIPLKNMRAQLVFANLQLDEQQDFQNNVG